MVCVVRRVRGRRCVCARSHHTPHADNMYLLFWMEICGLWMLWVQTTHSTKGRGDRPHFNTKDFKGMVFYTIPYKHCTLLSFGVVDYFGGRGEDFYPQNICIWVQTARSTTWRAQTAPTTLFSTVEGATAPTLFISTVEGANDPHTLFGGCNRPHFVESIFSYGETDLEGWCPQINLLVEALAPSTRGSP